MPHVTKRYRAAQATPGYEPLRRYELGAGVALLEKFPKARFDETVELHIRLGIDPKKSDQMVRGSVALPHGIGQSRSVVVFAEGEAAEAARAAGADAVGGEDLAERINAGWTDFDICIAHPSMMRIAGRLGRVLGPQGKMPSPKSGTVTDRVGEAVAEFKAGKVEFRADSGGNLHVPVGKRSFPATKIQENVSHFLEHVRGVRPSTVKGVYIRKVSISGTMTPGVTLDLA